MQPTIADNSYGSKLELIISARNLLDLDIFSKSDPYVKVLFRNMPGYPLMTLGQTETINNNLNPNFKRTFTLNYLFEARQDIVFEVYDEDDQKNQVNDDFIGRVETTLGALAGAKDQTSLLNLAGRETGKSAGKLIIRLEPDIQNNQYLKMKWKAEKLMNTDSWFDWWDKSDPYLKFLKIRNDKTYVEAYRTEIIMDNLNPDWKPVEIGMNKLFANDNPDCTFKIECWDWEKEGEEKHQFIGELHLSKENLMKIDKFPVEFMLRNNKVKNPGIIVLENMAIVSRPTFIDYIRGGLELNLSVAIDFTGSNGVPSQPNSLHFMYGKVPNQYQLAINAIGNILMNYDSDKRIPAFGFGAKPRFPRLTSPIVSHCFPLSGNYDEMESFGIEHLLQMYNNAIKCVELSGPTYFSPLITEFIKLAASSASLGSKTYQILLILTDGEIHDMNPTIDLIVRNCNLPLSIIIVGVGNADFTNMNTLDGDNGLYDSNGNKCARDIVQFVPFRDVQMNPDMLAQELLAELPGQVTQYMTMIGKPPGTINTANIDLLMKAPETERMDDTVRQHLTPLFGQIIDTQAKFQNNPTGQDPYETK